MNAALVWIHEAGNPYFDWLFGSPEEAQIALSDWMKRDTSEVAATRIEVVRDGEDEVGGFIGLDAADLRAARTADAIALVRGTAPAKRSALVAKLELARELFRVPDPGEFYLSKMGVHPSVRGRGHGRLVLDSFLARGRDLGAEVFSLDVAAGNERARRLYEDVGFYAVAEGVIRGSAVEYVSMLYDQRG